MADDNSVYTLTLSVDAETGKLKLEELKQVLGDVTTATKEVGVGGKEMGDAVAEGGLRALSAMEAFKIAVEEAKKAQELFNDAFKDFGAREDALTRLEIVLRNTGGAAGYSKEQLVKYAEELSDLSGLNTTNIITAEAMMATYNSVGKDTFPTLMLAATNVAKFMGTDMVTAAQLVGRAFERPDQAMRSLKQAGITLTQQQQNVIKSLMDVGQVAEAQTVVLYLLAKGTDGVAAAMGEGLNAKLSNVSEGFETLRIQMASTVEKEAKELLDWVIKYLGVTSEWVEQHKEMVTALGLLGATFAYVVPNAAIFLFLLPGIADGLKMIGISASLATVGLVTLATGGLLYLLAVWYRFQTKQGEIMGNVMSGEFKAAGGNLADVFTFGAMGGGKSPVGGEAKPGEANDPATLAKKSLADMKAAYDQIMHTNTGADLGTQQQIIDFHKQIREQINALNTQSLGGIAGEFAKLDLAVKKVAESTKEVGLPGQKRIIRASPQEIQDATDAMVDAKRFLLSKAIMEAQKDLVKVAPTPGFTDENGKFVPGFEPDAVQKEAQDRLKYADELFSKETDLRIANDKMMEDAHISTIQNEHDRDMAALEAKVVDYHNANLAIDQDSKLSMNYRAALIDQLTAKEFVANRDRVIDLQNSIAVLQVQTQARGFTGFNPFTGGEDNRRFQVDLQAKQLEQEQNINKLKLSNADADVISLQQQKDALEIQKMYVDEYNKLFDSIAGDAGKVFDDMLTSGKNVFQSLANFFKSIFLTEARRVFSELVASILTPVIAQFRGLLAGMAGNANSGVGLAIKNALGGAASSSQQATDLAKKIGTNVKDAMATANCGCIDKAVGKAAQQQVPTTAAGTGGLFGPALGIGGLGAGLLFAGHGATAGASGINAAVGFGGAATEAGGAAAEAGAAGAQAAFEALPAEATATELITSGGAAAAAGAAGGAFAPGLAASETAWTGSLGGGASSGLIPFLTNPITGIVAGAIIGGLLLYKFLSGRWVKKLHDQIKQKYGIDVGDKNVLKQIHGLDINSDMTQGILINYALQTNQDPSHIPLYVKFFGTPNTAGPTVIDQSAVGAGSTFAPGYGASGLLPPDLNSTATGLASYAGIASGGVQSPSAALGFTPGQSSVSGGAGVPVPTINIHLDPKATENLMTKGFVNATKNNARALTKAVANGLGSDFYRKQMTQNLYAS